MQQKALRLSDNPTAAEKTKTRMNHRGHRRCSESRRRRWQTKHIQQMLDAIGVDISETDLKNATVTIDGDTAAMLMSKYRPGNSSDGQDGRWLADFFGHH